VALKWAGNDVAAAKKLLNAWGDPARGKPPSEQQRPGEDPVARARLIADLCRRLQRNQGAVTAYRLEALVEFQGQFKQTGHIVSHLKQREPLRLKKLKILSLGIINALKHTDGKWYCLDDEAVYLSNPAPLKHGLIYVYARCDCRAL